MNESKKKMLDKTYIKSRSFKGFKTTAKGMVGPFKSLDEKYRFLFSECKGGTIIGTLALELLNFGGNKNIFWIDIDSRDWDAFRTWESQDDFPLSEGSYVAIPSSSGKIHIYVVSNRCLETRECFGMYEMLARSMRNPKLMLDLDRVYGPETPMHIYIPGAANETPTLPQDLVSDLSKVYDIPEVRDVSFVFWRQEKAHLRAELLNKLL